MNLMNLPKDFFSKKDILVLFGLLIIALSLPPSISLVRQRQAKIVAAGEGACGKTCIYERTAEGDVLYTGGDVVVKGTCNPDCGEIHETWPSSGCLSWDNLPIGTTYYHSLYKIPTGYEAVKSSDSATVSATSCFEMSLIIKKKEAKGVCGALLSVDLSADTQSVSIQVQAQSGKTIKKIEIWFRGSKNDPLLTESWSQIGTVGCGSQACSKKFAWNTINLPADVYYVAANIFDSDGNLCTGNAAYAETPKGKSAGWLLCYSCQTTVVVSDVPTPPTAMKIPWCEEGTIQDCYAGFCRGIQICRGGQWQSCVSVEEGCKPGPICSPGSCYQGASYVCASDGTHYNWADSPPCDFSDPTWIGGNRHVDSNGLCVRLDDVFDRASECGPHGTLVADNTCGFFGKGDKVSDCVTHDGCPGYCYGTHYGYGICRKTSPDCCPENLNPGAPRCYGDYEGNVPFAFRKVGEIEGVGVTRVSWDNATIYWLTNRPASCTLFWGKEAKEKPEDYDTIWEYPIKNSSGGEIQVGLKTSRGIMGGALVEPDTTYHFRFRCEDNQGNVITSEDHSFHTLKVPEAITSPTPLPDGPGPKDLYDLNKDSAINILDFSRFLSNYLKKGTGISGDFNGDGEVNILDLSLFIEALKAFFQK